MNVQETTNPQDAAQKLWEQIDAEEAGTAQPPIPVDAHNDVADDSNTQAAAPAQQADAQAAEEVLTPREQALMDRLAGLESTLNQTSLRLRNAEGHIGGLNNQLKQTLQTAHQVTAQGGSAPTAREIRAAQDDPAAMKALLKDYPELGTAMKAVLNESMSEMEERIRAQQPAQAQQPAGVSPAELNLMRSQIQVEVRHPGWQERVQTNEFQGWLQRQPREVQMLAASESPQDAVRLLDIHSEATKSNAAQRTQRLNSAAAIPSGRSGSNARIKPVEEMSKEELWRYQDELDKSKG